MMLSEAATKKNKEKEKKKSIYKVAEQEKYPAGDSRT